MNFSCYIPERYSVLRKTLNFADNLLHPIFCKKIDVAKIKKILILRQDRLGDLVATTPLLRSIKEALPGVILDIIINPKNIGIIKNNPFIDNILPAESNWFSYKKDAFIKDRFFSSLFSLKEIFPILKLIKKREYDVVIDCVGKRRNIILSFLSGIPHKFGFDIPGGSFLYSARVKRKYPSSYINQLAGLLAPLGIAIENPAPEIFISLDADNHNEKFKKDNNINENDNLIGAHLSHGGRLGKRWPAGSWIELIDKLIKSGKKVILFYGEAESEDFKFIKKTFKDNKNFIDPGILNLEEFIERLSLLKVFIAVESGPVHMASAMKIPTVALFGGSDPVMWALYGRGRILRKIEGSYCRKRECDDGFCIKAITPLEVFEAAENVFK